MRYAVLLKDDDGAVLAEVPDLPNVIATGATVEEATENVAEAIRLYLDELERRGIPAPPASTRVAMIPE